MPLARLAAKLRIHARSQAPLAAAMVGVGVVGALGQLVVDMPAGLFGAAERTTTIGIAYAAAMLALGIACGFGLFVRPKASRWVFTPLALIGIAFFLPALGTDPAVAAAVIGWMLFSVSRVVFAPVAPPRRIALPHDMRSPFVAAAIHLLALSLFATALVAGLRLTEHVSADVACVILDAVAIASAIALLHRRAVLKWAAMCAPLIAVATIGTGDVPTILGTIGVFQLGLLAMVVAQGPLVADAVRQFVERPALLVLTTFAGVIVVGGLALALPAAAEQGRVGTLDALFTSVSAVCVTGLVTVDTPTVYSTFGEATIVLLIQIGGLGIMVLSTFGTVILGGRLTLRSERALGNVLELSAPGEAYRLVRFIVVATFAIEAVGASILTWRFVAHGIPIGDALWRGTFHAISAFCNAGFALQTDSIIMFNGDAIALAVHAILIVLGGFGFVVLAWMWARIVRRVRSRPPVQVQVVLALSAAFVGLGALIYGVLEWNHTLTGLAPFDKVTNAIFQSVTMRTAGFNSVDLMAMRPATILLTITWMFIGAAPGGTAGGIKITTVAVLAAAIPHIVGARGGATLFGRSIAHATLQRAATIAVVATTTMVVALFLLLMTENAPFQLLAFEVVSALGTVGLSLGVTGTLSSTGKLVIIATMFIGRVGPLTLALALARGTERAISYPETRIMVG